MDPVGEYKDHMVSSSAVHDADNGDDDEEEYTTMVCTTISHRSYFDPCLKSDGNPTGVLAYVCGDVRRPDKYISLNMMFIFL